MLRLALRQCSCSGSAVRTLSTSSVLAIAPRRSPRDDRDYDRAGPSTPFRASAGTGGSQVRRHGGNDGGPKGVHERPRNRSSPPIMSAAEAERREALFRERQARGGLNDAKQYALARERERVLRSNWDKRDDNGRRRLEQSARAVGASAGGVSSAGADQREGQTARWKRGERRDREGGKGVSRGDQTARAPMVPGRVNRAAAQPVMEDRNRIQPVVRGGAPRSTQSQGHRRRRAQPQVMKKVTLPSAVRLENLTRILGVKLFHLQKAMERIGLENTRPERLLTAEDASLLALEFNFDPTIDDEAAFDLYPLPAPSAEELALLPLRPPVTGIFGHVDHGKTSLLDALRSTSVAAGEAGGITQHIGAFEVELETMVANLRARSEGGVSATAAASSSTEKLTGDVSAATTITFLDTPGHAAFTAMRSRGAGVTDVVVLVVAADDGVKPQTEEVINLIKTSDVGVVVALTKCDKPGIDIAKVKQQLMAAGVEIEDFGGDVPCVEVSSVTGQGLPELLETISTIAEVRELKAERDGRVEGRVLESRVEKGRGNVATVLVTRGCLRTASSLVAGTTWCRVRSLVPSTGKTLMAAYPGQPVEVTGWKDLPSAGDVVLEAGTEDEAKKAVQNRLRREETDKMWRDVEVINEKRRMEAQVESVRKAEEQAAKERGLRGNAVQAAGSAAVDEMEGREGGTGVATSTKELLLIIKADVSGTVEAVIGALEGIGNKEAKVKIVASAVGDVQESDVEMAKAIGACIVGFNVKAPKSVLNSAARAPTPVPVHTSAIIYRLVDTIRSAVADLLPKMIETRVHGEALVQQVFEISVKGRKEPMKVAGCKVGNGVFQKARKARVVRRGEVLHTGSVSTLKQVKKDVTEIPKGVECGIALDDFDGFEPEDILQSIEEIEVARTL